MTEHKAARETLTQILVALQQQTATQSYSIVHRINLAEAYKNLGYPDLAIGDAYKALLLVDELLDEGEYHDEVVEAATTDCLPEYMASTSVDHSGNTEAQDADFVVECARNQWSRKAHDLLIDSLLHCGCLRTAHDYIGRAKKAFPDDDIFEHYSISLQTQLRTQLEATGDSPDDVDVEEYPDKGLVRREHYPWNHHEPDRFSDECLNILNDELASIAPKLEVKVSELPVLTTNPSTNSDVTYTKQLGLFAREDISPGEQILEEKSLLTAISRLHELYCDACSILLPLSHDPASSEQVNDSVVTCEECDDVYFCSTDCHDLAQDSYHSSLCGVSVDQGTVPAKEAADNLYTLLLVRALALAETQELHPLELKEVRNIWGDYHGQDLDSTWQTDASGRLTDAFGSVPRTLPFSFKNNVLIPLHILEKMDVNIFTQSHRYDLWIFNTLYAKFRGTASARQGLDGRPETSAVHPMWCLANHSCDPNVAWEWQGTMRFWTREKLVDWDGRSSCDQPGLKEGEEVFGHYCDIRLPVNERRAWAVGALGGDCLCARCIWEAAEEQRHHARS